MTDSDVTYDWNGHTIRFNDWEQQPCGTYEYMARNGRHAFQFELIQVGSIIRIYILAAPSYHIRAQDGHSTHRIRDVERNRHFVCVRDDLQPTNVPDALSWLVYWAEETSSYIDTGRPF